MVNELVVLVGGKNADVSTFTASATAAAAKANKRVGANVGHLHKKPQPEPPVASSAGNAGEFSDAFLSMGENEFKEF